MPGLRGPGMYEYPYQLERIGLTARGIAEMLNRVWCHINLMREREVVIDLAALQRAQIEVESLEMEDQVVRNIFEASAMESQCLP